MLTLDEYQWLIWKSLSEEDWQRRVTELADHFGWTWYHPWSSVHSKEGWPDLFLVRGPRAVAIELKREGKKPTAKQEIWLTHLQNAGIETHWFQPSSWDEVVAVLT